MSKYLIQDIVPAHRKQRKAASVDVKKPIDEEYTITHPEHPIRKTPLAVKKTADPATVGNPWKMIAEQIGNDDPEQQSKEDIPVEAPCKSAKMFTPEQRDQGYEQYTEQAHDAPVISVPPPEKPPRFPEYASMGSGGQRRLIAWLPWLAGLAIVLVGIYLLFNFLSGATISIVPKNETLPIDEKFTAVKSAGANELAYAIMSTTTSLSLEVPATGEKTVTTKASGKIIIYNEQSNTQRLIKNTRFQAPSGKVYRISDSVTVPKATVSGGKATPGSLQVTVYADEAGPEYNSDPIDFTLPGLKGSALFTKVYARSNGSMTGGASGTIKTVSDQDLKQAGETLRVQLETKLRSKARGDLAPFQIAYDQSIVVELGQPVLSKAQASANNKAVVTEEGTISVVFFKRADLTKAIAKKLVNNYEGEDINIKNLESLEFSMSPQNGSALMNGTKLDFILKGTSELIWVIDDAAVKTALVGTPKDSFNNILSKYPSVERAQASVSPIWNRLFPDDPGRITIELVDKLSE
ncbi:MAG: hypothetical protein A2942_04155 [Candidatus Lloydbacteria bacterium RIFCSPLOWO2_01_FULL_50_20]|uniref:GlxA-like beta barrel domain-containing protein n=1 Tax=Candidatus Lloydbacteria bacterium RIFCSPLOWO2_01_FULL_50_20 TaxID=1798665 RepID=A0A1G2DCN5_9BACT|nr:MAG: hypothetical protein A3C13_01305 [Candidatus Lloydbacteria bacterium RIFCSPHIGHO2_02_FULL_50_11]OGZ11376.1 MAG: hypothetical protein A2942_04155 [Candidatus Lloydbacteria bacterium RIFCSPLOWO2_01_FULL_50_20]